MTAPFDGLDLAQQDALTLGGNGWRIQALAGDASERGRIEFDHLAARPRGAPQGVRLKLKDQSRDAVDTIADNGLRLPANGVEKGAIGHHQAVTLPGDFALHQHDL
ncbi:MAG: hypothetical protein Q8M01_06335 [Rubrivivax sp.]|nr:hypothetical protein [Rubrivivax sp.]